MQQNRAKTEQTVAFWWDRQKRKKLQMLAYRMSIEQDKRITYSDLIREALDKTYPELNKWKPSSTESIQRQSKKSCFPQLLIPVVISITMLLILGFNATNKANRFLMLILPMSFLVNTINTKKTLREGCILGGWYQSFAFLVHPAQIRIAWRKEEHHGQSGKKKKKKLIKKRGPDER